MVRPEARGAVTASRTREGSTIRYVAQFGERGRLAGPTSLTA